MENPDTPIPRHLVAVDLENLAGAPLVAVDWARGIGPCLTSLLGLAPRDLVYVAGAPRNGMAVCTVAGDLHGQARTKRGKNGADLVLIEALESTPESALHSSTAPIGQVVIASGDGIFTNAARRFRRLGLEVVVVARRASLHRALATACTRVIHLDDHHGPTGHDLALAA